MKSEPMRIPRAEAMRMLNAIRAIEALAVRLRCPEENVLMEIDRLLERTDRLERQVGAWDRYDNR